jgi:hypothetical protein
MRETKLFYYLRTMDKKEQSVFADFLDSPFFNKDPKPVALFAVLRNSILNSPKKQLSNESAYDQCFPGTPFNANALRKTQTALLHLFTEFLTFQAMKKDLALGHPLLLNELIERRADKYFHNHQREALKDIGNWGKGSADQYQHQYGIGMAVLRYQNRNENRNAENSLPDISQSLDRAYEIRKLRIIYTALNQARIMGSEIDPEWQEFVRKRLDNEDRENTDNPLASIYLLLCSLILEPEIINQYHDLMSLLHVHHLSFKREELADVYIGSMNYCVQRINRGDFSFRWPLYELFQKMLKAEMLLDAGKLSPFHFKNIVSLGSKLGEFDWVEGFISSYGPNLAVDDPQGPIDFNRAVLHFHRQDYELSEQLFHRAQPVLEDVFYSLDIRVYLLWIYFETENISGMDALTLSYRIYLQRNNQVAEEKKQRYYDFIRWFRRLYQTPPYETKRLEKLRKEIEEKPRTPGSEWLLGKIGEKG